MKLLPPSSTPSSVDSPGGHPSLSGPPLRSSSNGSHDNNSLGGSLPGSGLDDHMMESLGGSAAVGGVGEDDGMGGAGTPQDLSMSRQLSYEAGESYRESHEDRR